MRKYVSLAVVLAAVILGAWFVRGRRVNEISPGAEKPQNQGQNMVLYTDQGYSPATLTVRVGTTVVFQNQSSGIPMWTASNIHPTHTILLEFDALTAAPPGESYSFTFSKTGTWKYHNHLKPADGGTIIVE